MLPTGHLGRGYLRGLFFLFEDKQTFKKGGEAVAAESPYRYPLWLARALNSAFYDVKWDYESDRAIARIADFYIKIAVFIINLCCCAPFCKYT